MLVYSVVAVVADPELAQRYIQWLRDGHVEKVCEEGGALDGEVTAELDASSGVMTVVSRYHFATQAEFDAYASDEVAARLRGEFAEAFPEGVKIAGRSTVESVVWYEREDKGVTLPR